MKRLRWTWLILGGIAIILAISIVYLLTLSRPMAPRQGERAAIEEEVEPAPEAAPPPPRVGAWIAGNCVVEPLGQERRVAGQTAGRIANIPVDEGDTVQAGDVLVALAADTERAAVTAARAETEQAEAELSLLEAGTRPEEIEAARAEARAAAARAERSRGVFERLERASGGGGVTEDELDQARHQARADQKAAESAAATLRQAVRGPREQEVAEAEARAEAAKAQVQRAETELAARQLEAPISGQVLEVAQLPGEFYQPGDVVVILGDTRSLRARMEVDERDVDAVKVGAAARVWVPSRTREARVAKVGRRVKPKEIFTEDPGGRTDVRVLEVELALPNDGDLVVGQRGLCYAAAAGEQPDREPAASTRRGGDARPASGPGEGT